MAQIQNEFIAAQELIADEMDLRVFDEFPSEWDVSYADWIALNETWDDPQIHAVASQLSTSIVGREPEDIGAHYWFDYLKAGKGIQSLLSEGELGAQGQLIKTGKSNPKLSGPIRLC